MACETCDTSETYSSIDFFAVVSSKKVFLNGSYN